MEAHQIIPTNQVLPPKLEVLPITGNPIFPGIFTPMLVA
jgi:ATP-dependent Lon protease